MKETNPLCPVGMPVAGTVHNETSLKGMSAGASASDGFGEPCASAQEAASEVIRNARRNNMARSSSIGKSLVAGHAHNELQIAGHGDIANVLGMDSRWDRWLAGVTLAHSEGEGAYTHREAAGGSVNTTLTSLNPYLHYRLNERASLWAVVGFGVGGLKLTPTGAGYGAEPAVGSAIETNLAATMAAFGGRGLLTARADRADAFELAIVSDALLTNTVSEAAENLMGATARTSRLRVMLEGSGSMPLASGGVLTPTLAASLRYDGGDAETGAGIEVGRGLAYAVGQLAVEGKARALLAHEDTEYEEWGFSGSIRHLPRPEGRGWSINVGSAWGATQSRVQSLWAGQYASGPVRGRSDECGAAVPGGDELRHCRPQGLGERQVRSALGAVPRCRDGRGRRAVASHGRQARGRPQARGGA